MTDERAGWQQGGFSLIEVIIAMVILTVGVLALASAMVHLSRQVRAADLRTDRTVATQQAVERVRAIGYDSVSTRTETDAWQVGSYSVWWDLNRTSQYMRSVDLFVEGPAYRRGEGVVDGVRDTVFFSLVK